MARPAARTAAQRFDEEMMRNRIQAMVEIFRAGCFIKPCGIEYDDTTRGGILTECEENFSVWQFQCLRLMDAFVDFLIRRVAEFAIIGVVADAVQDDFAEAFPCLAVVFRDGGMERVAVSEDGFPCSIQFRWREFRRFCWIACRQHGRVVPNEKESSVL